LTRITGLEAQGGWTEADVLNLALLKDNLLRFRDGISSSGPKGCVLSYIFVVPYADSLASVSVVFFSMLLHYVAYCTLFIIYS